MEPSHTFNSRESIISRIPQTPAPNKTKIVKELQPVVPVVKPKQLSPEEAEYQKQKQTFITNVPERTKQKYENATEQGKAHILSKYMERFNDLYHESTVINQALHDQKKEMKS